MTGLIGYTLGIPDGPNNPSNDQPNMKTNNDNIAAYVGKDHVPFNVDNSGYHTIIHQTVQTTDPAPIAGIGQIYTKDVTIGSPPATDGQLFYRTPLGGISQLTGSRVLPNGFEYLGGVILQWGSALAPDKNTSSTTINFPIPFNGNAFSVVTTIQKTGSDAQDIAVIPGSVGPLSFAIRNSDSSARNFYWMAIGSR